MSQAAIPFVDLKAQYSHLKADIDARIARVLEHGAFIMGPEVAELEKALGAFCGAKHVISCSSGTDALQMVLMAENIGPGDAVFMPSFTFTATAEVVLLLGAEPVFVDVDGRDFNIDLASLEAAIARVQKEGRLKPRGVIAVDLFGLPADYSALKKTCDQHGMLLLADAAQSFGGARDNTRVGLLAPATATSFFPAKPLGCYGDGGAIFVQDDETAHVLRSIRAHGKGDDKYDIVRVGVNGRLDTIQAAVLLAKLPSFAAEIEAREKLSQHYDAMLKGLVVTPIRPKGTQSAWAQYSILTPKRDELAAKLKAAGVPTAVYYPRPMHLQTAYAQFGGGPGSLPVSEKLSGEILALPMHPFMPEETADRIGAAIKAAL
ncbi:DegT/DnrJ/EryC1/StrS aminotransferase family protein [Ferrovibrio sp.]|uniref:DegT/DnrJ/EryC1/StrS family aminotransferase n=1 Tax=Ferrovibrio sp. TaxID=1917215 RepID=UPI0025C06F84|nr:DegT/DnrJ/EryC1/StrS aminotransferase family protein [Ferrovibrio sp.]MBX3453181.1 DegT/DnrJ/EryC1/StrS aminotransferase family protein [Ferrovibrio sp.]